jgi:hypothetical protein
MVSLTRSGIVVYTGEDIDHGFFFLIRALIEHRVIVEVVRLNLSSVYGNVVIVMVFVKP